MTISRPIEKALAVASFLVAAALAFTALLISSDNSITSSVLFVIAQFLLFSASILGLDYKFNVTDIIQSSSRGAK